MGAFHLGLPRGFHCLLKRLKLHGIFYCNAVFQAVYIYFIFIKCIAVFIVCHDVRLFFKAF